MGTTIKRDEWLKALADAGIDDTVDDQDAMTTDEFAAAFGVNRFMAEERLKKLVAAGKAVRTKKFGLTSAGKRFHFLAYRLLPEGPTGSPRTLSKKR